MAELYPLSVELKQKNLEKLIKTYQDSYKQILEEINGATEFGATRRKEILAQVDTILKDLGAQTQKQLEADFADMYKDGANDAIRQLRNIGADIKVAAGFSQVHKKAITALVDEVSNSFADAITGVSRTAERLLTTKTKEMISQQIATGVIAGDALKTARQRIKGILQEEGLTALTDKGGRPWSLDRYAEMLYRTKSVEARNRGLINRMYENEYDLVQVSYHNAKCPLCGPWESKILSISGNTAGYPKLDDAVSAGLFHPNCRHAINTIIPSLAKRIQAYNNGEETKIIPPDEVKKASKVMAQPKPSGSYETVTAPSGVQIRKSTAADDIQRFAENVRYNAAFQVEGLRTMGGGTPKFSVDVVKAIDAIDVSKAKSPAEAGQMILSALPKSMHIDVVENTINQWANTMQAAFVQKGLSARQAADTAAQFVYRATGGNYGKGEAVLGSGKYVAYSQDAVKKYGDTIEEYVLSPGAKIMDLQDASALTRFTEQAISENRDLYAKLLQDKGADSALGTVMRKQAEKLGFDGIRGDDEAFGTVVFNESLLKLRKVIKKT